MRNDTALAATSAAKVPTAAELKQMLRLYEQKRYADLEPVARQMAERYREAGEVWTLWGLCLMSLGKNSVPVLQAAARLLPDDAQSHTNLGAALRIAGRFDDALATLQRSLAINPRSAAVHSNMGNVLASMGRIEESVQSLRQALLIEPTFAGAFSNLLFWLSHSDAIDPSSLFTEHCNFGDRYEAPLRARWPRHTNVRDPERRLRVGFVSGDLYHHAVANFIEPVLMHLTGSPQLSLHAYSNHEVNDRVSQRLRGYMAEWHAIADLSDEALARKILADRIDILIDLSGHTARNRLLAFARKPAPVQISWIGYPCTTGLTAMDYFFTDRFKLPPGQFDDQFTEALVHLPASAPFLPFEQAPAVSGLPALRNGYVTFGTFNRLAKLNRSVIAVWSQLLRALPDAILLFGGMPEASEYGDLVGLFAQEGVGRERLRFHQRSDMTSYLSLHQKIDICLDTFPYTGGTTSCHALWMGVPTLTMAGRTAASRAGAAVLGRVALDGFAADDADDFVQKGVAWANNLPALADIRAGMRDRFAGSAVGQPAVIASAFERSLRVMWQRWCAGMPAGSFSVDQES
jgi:protein O-GlcNAc transferase